MITTTQMYWIVTLNSIVTMSVICFVIGLIASIAAIGVALDTGDHWWLPKCTIALTILSFLAATFIPSTKQMAAIIIVPAIVNNEKVQTVGNKVYDLAVEWLDDWMPKKEAK